MGNIFYKLFKQHSKQILLFAIWCLLSTSAFSQTYNDGRIRLRIWVNKVWTDANCSEVSNQNYAWTGIRVRAPLNNIGAYDYSNVFDCRADGQEARYFDRTMFAEVRANGAPNETNGYKLFDVT